MHIDRRVSLGFALIVGVGGPLALGIYSGREPKPEDTRLQPPKTLPFETPEDLMSQKVKQVESEGFDCEPIPKDSWLIQELRVRGTPGIDPGPYKIIHLDGSVQYFQKYGQLPNLVKPGEEFCIKKVEPQSFEIDQNKRRGVVFDRTQNKMFVQNSINIQALIRVKQGF